MASNFKHFRAEVKVKNRRRRRTREREKIEIHRVDIRPM
jgi:hypothetical protein